MMISEQGHQYEGQLEEIGSEYGESLDKIQPECIDSHDLDIVDYYFANCAECRKATNPGSEWFVVAADAMDAGWRKVESEVYCKECIPLIMQRIEEEEDESSWRNRNV